MAVAAAEQLEEQDWRTEYDVLDQQLDTISAIEVSEDDQLLLKLAVFTTEVGVVANDALEPDVHEPSYAESTVLSSACAHPPESEIYGRSLSAVRRLGAYTIGKTLAEVIHSPEAEQAKVEFNTSVEEGFGTDVELGGGLEVRDFDFRPVTDGKVMAKDLKTPISDMTKSGLVCAQETAKTDKRFLPQLTRSKHDHDNALFVDAMARGETPYNTRIVVSPFPEEAAAQSGDAYWQNIGYVPHLKRGFVQMYHTTEDGIVSGSLSFDGSDSVRLRKLFAKKGVDIPEAVTTDNWLHYAITATFSEDEAKQFALDIANEAGDPKYKKTTNTTEVTSAHRKIMDMVFNDSYVHVCESLVRGYQTADVRKLVLQFADKAEYFNGHYATALYAMQANQARFTDDDAVVLHELLVYATIEMMRAVHLRETELPHENSNFQKGAPNDAAYLQSLNPALFQNMLSGFAAAGAINNRTYSACGLSISLGEAGNPQDVFGGVDNDTSSKKSDLEDCDFISKECPKCKKKNVKTTVKKGKYYGDCGCIG